MITVNGDSLPWQEGMTVRDVLTAKKYTFRMLVVRINGTVIPKTCFDTAVIPDGAVVDVIHLISGG
ncbi:MAG: sulfur carrier protein ThiS [Candidatus Fermentibacteraceae bacterium]